jgi:hypothetical protein
MDATADCRRVVAVIHRTGAEHPAEVPAARHTNLSRRSCSPHISIASGSLAPLLARVREERRIVSFAFSTLKLKRSRMTSRRHGQAHAIDEASFVAPTLGRLFHF